MPEEPCTVLLVDDDRASREAMTEWLRSEGFGVISAANGDEALGHLHDGVAVIVTDLKMPRTDGLALLRKAKQEVPHAAVILVSGYGTVDTAVAALKDGAFDFLAKPVKPEELTSPHPHGLGAAVDGGGNCPASCGTQPARTASRTSWAVAPPCARFSSEFGWWPTRRSTVLILGESGTGKEMVARAIHESSGRRAKPFVPVNCAAIPETLVESELFGHEKGAFTGASESAGRAVPGRQRRHAVHRRNRRASVGVAEQAAAGDRVQENHAGGSTKETEVDVRLIAATNKDLADLTKQGQFPRRSRTTGSKVVELRLPPLRERREDIPLLAHYFIEQIAAEDHRPVRGITPGGPGRPEGVRLAGQCAGTPQHAGGNYRPFCARYDRTGRPASLHQPVARPRNWPSSPA